jgi:hypothetical protein
MSQDGDEASNESSICVEGVSEVQSYGVAWETESTLFRPLEAARKRCTGASQELVSEI